MVEQRKLYVRYSISGEVAENGIAYSVKQAANVFIKTHGFDGRVTEMNVSAGNFHAVLELFDNGKYDFNTHALNEHLRVSGRLPTKESMRPEINIKPLPCDSEIVIKQDSPDLIAYQKSLDKFQQAIKENEDQLKQKESTIRGLNSILQERQGRIEAGEERISSLEKKVSEAQPVQYDTARDAILNGYLKDAHDTYLDLSIDLTALAESGNIEFFQGMGGRGKPIFAEYLNSIYGTQFKSDQEVDKWKKKVDKSDFWQDLEEAKRIAAARKPYLAEEALLKSAEKLGVNSTTLAMLRTKVMEGRAKRGELESEMESVREKFEKDKEFVRSLGPVREKYSQLEVATENSTRRRKTGISLPVVIEVLKDQSGITLFMPYDDSKCSLEKLFYHAMYKHVQEFIPQGTELVRLVKNNASRLTAFLSLDSEKLSDQVMTVSGKIADEITENETLRALGVQTKVTIIADVCTRPTRCPVDSSLGKKN